MQTAAKIIGLTLKGSQEEICLLSLKIAMVSNLKLSICICTVAFSRKTLKTRVQEEVVMWLENTHEAKSRLLHEKAEPFMTLPSMPQSDSPIYTG